MCEEIILPKMLQINTLPPQLADIVKEQNEDPIQLRKDVDLIKKWIEDEPSLKGIPSDQFIVNCLRARQYDVEVVKRKYKANLKARTDLNYVFQNRNIHEKEFQEIFRLGGVFPLKNPFKEDDPIYMIYRPKTFKVDLYTQEVFARPYSAIYDITMHKDDNFAIFGQVAIVDCSDVGFKIAMGVTWSHIRKLLTFAQKTSPFLIKEIHLINVPTVLKYLMHLVLHFVSHKTLSKIYFHWGFESLYKHVPQKILPKEFGGDGPTIDELVEQNWQIILANEEFLSELDELYVDES